MTAGAPFPEPVLIAGPTATGKSEAALLLAERLGGEIVSVDSMQVYRGLDIGTAKPSAEERRRAPHHLIDVAELTEAFDAARFVELARKAVSDIQSRGRTPILCGGTGLYFKAFLGGLGQVPATDPAMRAALEAAPVAELLAELARHDPEAYERIDRQNPRRVIRAVEVIRLTGKPFSAQRARWADKAETPGEPRVFGLCRPGEDLRRRIDLRVDEMFRRGLVTETEGLLQRGLAANRNALQALGYRQVAEHLQGARGLAETVTLVKARTRNFAKRQMTWFRKQIRVTWIEIQDAETPAAVCDRLEERLRR